MTDTPENRTFLYIPYSEGISTPTVENQSVQPGSQVESTERETELFNSESNDRAQRWTQEAILLLLRLYKGNLYLFKTAEKTNKLVWNSIAKNMTSYGYSFTGEQCENLGT